MGIKFSKNWVRITVGDFHAVTLISGDEWPAYWRYY